MKTLQTIALSVVFGLGLVACGATEFGGVDAGKSGAKLRETATSGPSAEKAKDKKGNKSSASSRQHPEDGASKANDKAGSMGDGEAAANARGATQTGDKDAAGNDGEGDKSGADGQPGAASSTTAAAEGAIDSLDSSTSSKLSGTPDANEGKLGDPAQAEVVNDQGQAQTAEMSEAMQQSMQGCLKRWGLFHPFRSDRRVPDRIIFGHLELGPANRVVDAVFGTELSGITDTKVTDKPALIMISASINLLATDFILPTVKYRFLNPNGWYCIHLEADVGSSVKFELKKGAQLADPNWAFGFLADTVPVAKNSISILSKSEIEEIP